MLALTATQRKKLRELEESSFRHYCVRCGYNEYEHAALLLSFAKQSFGAVIGSKSIDDIPDEQLRSHILFLVLVTASCVVLRQPHSNSNEQ
jgi:hypothetical protein